ncbi:TatD family hydrolase [Buchnera aphidicola]|uniref:TatD family hydrolase n=1 Tax=Buchnera aphidicola TaxID=9 RepID=UPI0031B6D8DA
MFLIDSHCHLNLLNFKKKKINKILKNAYSKNIKIILTISISLKNFKNLLQTIKKKNIFFSCGLHPILKHNKKDIKLIKKFSQIKKVIAIGETGLDFFQKNPQKINQEKLFKKHIQIAKKLNKPLIVHSREAKDQTIKILKSENAYLCSGILHSFTEDINMIKKLLDLNFYISFSGIITFKNSDTLRKTLKFVPLNRLLIETDAPYLTPVPYRGKENQPKYLYEIAKYISKIFKKNIIDFSKILKKNFFTLFKLSALKFEK